MDFGISRDEASSLSAALASALDGCDLLVTTGGVSMGDRDILRQVLKDVFSAEIHFARSVTLVGVGSIKLKWFLSLLLLCVIYLTCLLHFFKMPFLLLGPSPLELR